MKVALYARVSTKDREQNPETQLQPLRKYCHEKGYTIYKEYTDRESGRKPERKQLNQLKRDVIRTRDIETILLWKMDRLSRGGIRDTFKQIDFFKNRGIHVVSLTEPFLSTDNPSAELILAVLAWSAEQESKNIGVRVKAGIERVRKEGKRWGRGRAFDHEEASKLRDEGWSYRKIANALGVSSTAVYEALTKSSKNVSTEREVENKGINIRDVKLTGDGK